MNFLGIGPAEVFLTLIVAVVVLGPERIPGVAVQLAKTIRYLRGYATDATSQLRAEIAELTKEYEEVRKELSEFRQAVRSDITSVTDEVSRVLEQVQPIVEPGGEAPPERGQTGPATTH